MNNKGVSALFATLILIGFAIGLGTIILKMGAGLGTTASSIGECRNFNILQIDAQTSTPSVCFGEYKEMTKPINEQNINALNIKYDNNNKYILQIK